ncbi:hypothetical protein [Delftia acidovorans]|uniref:hypothetical protein n=1 Tax=Delftia acidovorans TaxID=80866 RepID=UPI0000E92CBC|nr:hypothetical protein [Delftia acidovorans]QPS74624.1 hypothetical protein I6G48_29140 [Delftia acidovorans]
MNLFKRFERLLPRAPRRVGTVLAVDGTTVRVEEVGGNITQVVGEATVGQQVYIRNSAIEGPAPNLPLEDVEE